MKEKIFNILSYFLPVTAGMILILFIVAFVSTVIKVWPIHWDFSNEGFKSFFNTYSSSLQLGAAFLGVMAITLTLERMKQTKTQIDVMTDNNKFNNFYKHRDEFIKFFKDKIIINELISELDNSPTEIITVFYGKYYSNNFSEFSSRINHDTKENLEKFISKLKNSNLVRGHFDFFAFEKEYLQDIVGLFDYHWPDTLGIVIKKSEKQQAFRENYNALVNKNCGEQFHLLFCIYFTITIASIVYAFEGLDIKGLTDYYRNYDLYLQKSNLFNSIVKR